MAVEVSLQEGYHLGKIIESILVEAGVRDTQEIVSTILGSIGLSEKPEGQILEEFIRNIAHTFVMGLKSTVNDLKTKEGALRELDFLKNNPGDIGVNRLKEFLKEVVSAEKTETIAKELKVHSKMVGDYLEENAWINGMSDDLYLAFKKFIDASYG